MWNIVNVIVAKIEWRGFGTLAFKQEATIDLSFDFR